MRVQAHLNGGKLMLKRTFDITMALVGLIVTAPILIAVACLVKASSRGPVLFRQARIGRGGRPFDIYKFRSMRTVAGADTGDFEMGGSPRVTGVGKLLRATKLDELPQLWNVVRGEMALVGPRPEVARWVAVYPQRWAFVHTVRPGITDLASVHFRNEEQILASSSDPERTYREELLPRKLGLYEEYVRSRSFWGDLIILWKTVCVVFVPSSGNCLKTETRPLPEGVLAEELPTRFGVGPFSRSVPRTTANLSSEPAKESVA